MTENIMKGILLCVMSLILAFTVWLCRLHKRLQ